MPIRTITSLCIYFLVSLSFVGCNSSKPVQLPPEDSASPVNAKTIINLPAPAEKKRIHARTKTQPKNMTAASIDTESLPPMPEPDIQELAAKPKAQAAKSSENKASSECSGDDCEKDDNDEACGGCDFEQICDPSIECERRFCPHPRCCVNSDCPADQYCIGYDCMPCEQGPCGKTCCPPSFSCVNDECFCAGKVCNGVCNPIAQCCIDTDCPVGSTCNSNNQCVVCQGRICVPGKCLTGATCCTNADCVRGSTCNSDTTPANQCVVCNGVICSGTCKKNASCCNNADCPVNNTCIATPGQAADGPKICVPCNGRICAGVCQTNANCCVDADCSSNVCTTNFRCRPLFPPF